MPRTSRLTEWVAFAVVMAWGLYQCFWNLAGPNVSADEPIYVDAGWDYLHGDIADNQEHPPFAKYLMGLGQLAFGQGLLTGRSIAALAAFATGVVLYFWLRREIGWVGALAAAGFWLLLPHGVITNVRLDRLALLEPFMVLFAVVAFAAVWQWFRGRPWWWLVVAGTSMAFSVTSKVSSAVLIPVLLVFVALRRPWRRGLAGLALFCGVGAVVGLLVYLPVGLFDSVRYMLDFQSQHDATGHLIAVAGVAYTFPPWWSNLWFWFDGMGVVPVLVVLVGTVASVFSRRWALLGMLGSAIALLLVFYLLVSDVALGHYYYAWVWLFCAAAGVGVAELLRPKTSRVLLSVTRIGAVLLLAVAVVCGVWTSAVIAGQRASGMALVLPELESLGIDEGDIYVAGMAPWEFVYPIEGRWTTELDDPDIVAFALKDQVRFPLDAALTAELEERAGELDRFTIDDVTLYVVKEAERPVPAG
ncbi:glycosyltransferase family 39 protein [Herbiconiux sp. KACC 21604]|uniref:ArnT family glycosyltransferase n=1 Tax=unclassified Herbiconiux TaxID=2618217 RepID=UPI0014912166|nr:glycosyltransferase family 39 protein [Herbiconiux sp. SALV-R1]QJU53493.1 hypothetical protein HL652_07530 [Herbiconiux sp. SALV-R1]WPO88469.1 glycosyltransferase family 39 protein [Herbiconiux sp. KACC 21604]